MLHNKLGIGDDSQAALKLSKDALKRLQDIESKYIKAFNKIGKKPIQDVRSYAEEYFARKEAKAIKFMKDSLIYDARNDSISFNGFSADNMEYFREARAKLEAQRGGHVSTMEVYNMLRAGKTVDVDYGEIARQKHSGEMGYQERNGIDSKNSDAITFDDYFASRTAERYSDGTGFEDDKKNTNGIQSARPKLSTSHQYGGDVSEINPMRVEIDTLGINQNIEFTRENVNVIRSFYEIYNSIGSGNVPNGVRKPVTANRLAGILNALGITVRGGRRDGNDASGPYTRNNGKAVQTLRNFDPDVIMLSITTGVKRECAG